MFKAIAVVLMVPIHLIILQACASVKQVPPHDGLAIEHVNIITMETDTILLDQSILIADGRVKEFGPHTTIQIPDEYEILDGMGQYLMPGLNDMHVHLRHADKSALQRYLRAGITFVREMNGRPFLLEWRDQIEAGTLLGPRLIVASPTIGNFSSPREGYATPSTPEEASERVLGFKNAGYDLIKVHNFVPRDIFFAILDAGLEHGIPIGGHLSVEVALDEVIGTSFSSIEHLTGYFDVVATSEGKALDVEDFSGTFFGAAIDDKIMTEIAKKSASTDLWITPTISWFTQNNPFSGSRNAWAQSDRRSLGVQNRLKMVAALHEAGAKLILGTDSDDGDQLPATIIHEELLLMMDAGLSAFEALRLATVAPAEYLNISDSGVIKKENRADLIILACNPLENIRCTQYLSHVIFDGQVVH